MNKLGLLILTASIIYPAMIFAQSDSPITFTKKEIAFIKYGNGEKETSWGRSFIQIDGNDNVYFYNGNGQLLVVSSNGKSIKVMDGKKITNLRIIDAEGNIYSPVYKKGSPPGFVMTKPDGTQTEYPNFDLSCNL
jgi:hypothetical protein